MVNNDIIGNVLRDFYAIYGRPNEGPPKNFNVSSLLGNDYNLKDELGILKSAINNQSLQNKFNKCNNILEDLATRLTTEELLRELSELPPIQEKEFDKLSSGILWFSLASTLDQRQNGLPVTPFDKQLNFSFQEKIQMSVIGSLVLRLYVALVYIREGVLNNMISDGANARKPCCGQVKKLINSDYVRHLRNSLSHGSFSPSIAGIIFHDEDKIIVGTPEFLSWLCTWLNIIQLQALTASKVAD
ncbi:MAG: hypothetical protein OEV87_05555 [Phycisphaerae bacterium]|nr:hypothetical protein [Phycisphaerae bacterium]